MIRRERPLPNRERPSVPGKGNVNRVPQRATSSRTCSPSFRQPCSLARWPGCQRQPTVRATLAASAETSRVPAAHELQAVQRTRPAARSSSRSPRSAQPSPASCTAGSSSLHTRNSGRGRPAAPAPSPRRRGPCAPDPETHCSSAALSTQSDALACQPALRPRRGTLHADCEYLHRAFSNLASQRQQRAGQCVQKPLSPALSERGVALCRGF